MKLLPLSMFLFMITACSPNLDTKVNDLVVNKNKWIKSSPNRNYSYTYKHQCHHCVFNNEDIRIQVQNGIVLSATFKSGEKRDGNSLNNKIFKNMKQHFEYILEVLKKEEREKSMTIKVEYNKTLGHPSLIKVNSKNLMFGKRIILISNVVLN